MREMRTSIPGCGSTAGTGDTQTAFCYAYGCLCARWPHEEYDIAPHKGQARSFDAHVLVLQVIEQRPA
eukprot:scaffold83722_cov69-Phaeocystis_antarctica.AAC.4